MTVQSVGAILAAGYWETQSGAATSAPGNGKFQADNWAAPTLLAFSAVDADGYDRHAGLVAALPGDLCWQTAPNDSQNYQRWTVVSVTDNGSWTQAAVTVAETGPAFVPPGTNQRRLVQLLSLAQPSGALPWQAWAPPLDPPTTGGLPQDTAQAIADACWSTDPHLCAALQWEAYAAMLPPTPAVANVSTGAQAVSYSPPMPGGDYGLAMARAAWHRSLRGNAESAELVLAPPAISSVPPGLMPAWWEVA